MYDSANQLIRFNFDRWNFTRIWTYDGAGNILSDTRYPYTTGEISVAAAAEMQTAATTSDEAQWQPRDESDRVAASANLSLQANTQATLSTTPLDAVTYDYDDPDWGDLMTGYVKDGTTYAVTSDAVGNPLSDGERTYTWKHGRQIDTMTKGGVTWTYEYNSDGLRTARTSATKDYFYVYNGTQLTQVTIVDKSVTPNATTVIDLGYDATGTPLTLTIDGETYYYLTNIQGDVMGVIDESGVRHVSYFYDGFGRSYFLANTDDGDMISSIDPLGYRGYLLDNGTGLYYLQSRSYNPKVGRFINADSQLAFGDPIGMNLFAYCSNNPVNRIDPSGEAWLHWILGAAVVAACAVATVITCGGFAAAATAVCLVANGVAAATTASTIAAGAFIGSAMIYGTAVLTALDNSSTAEEFAEQGNWGTVFGTMAGGAYGGYYGSSISNSSKQTPIEPNIDNGSKTSGLHTSGTGSPNKNVNPNGSYTKLDSNGNIYSYTQFDSQGRQTMRIDFQGKSHAGVLPHIHLFKYLEQGGRSEYVFNLFWELL